MASALLAALITAVVSPEDVAARNRVDAHATDAGEQPAQARHVTLEGGTRRRRGAVGPQAAGEIVGRLRLLRVQRQHRQQVGGMAAEGGDLPSAPDTHTGPSTATTGLPPRRQRSCAGNDRADLRGSCCLTWWRRIAGSLGSAPVALRWTDDHCHLGWEGDGPVDVGLIDAMVADARAAGVDRLVTVGTDRARSADAVAAAARHPEVVWATVGLHPHDAANGLDGLPELLGEPGVVAVGECGLDYHYDHSPRDVQRRVFADADRSRPRARPDPRHPHPRGVGRHFAVLDAEGVPERTVFHCFTGGPVEAEACLARGGHLSFSGIVTFKTADDVRAAAALCPLDRALVETDSPYLAPVPHRGRPNRPSLVPLVGEAVAAAKGVAVDVVASATWANAARVYRLPPG